MLVYFVVDRLINSTVASSHSVVKDFFFFLINSQNSFFFLSCSATFSVNLLSFDLWMPGFNTDTKGKTRI